MRPDFAGEFHFWVPTANSMLGMRRANYLGPGTRVGLRETLGPPFSSYVDEYGLDEAAKAHDISYGEAIGINEHEGREAAHRHMRQADHAFVSKVLGTQAPLWFREGIRAAFGTKKLLSDWGLVNESFWNPLTVVEGLDPLVYNEWSVRYGPKPGSRTTTESALKSMAAAPEPDIAGAQPASDGFTLDHGHSHGFTLDQSALPFPGTMHAFHSFEGQPQSRAVHLKAPRDAYSMRRHLDHKRRRRLRRKYPYVK